MNISHPLAVITFLLLMFTNNVVAILDNIKTEYVAKDIASKTSDLKPNVLKLAINAFNKAKKIGIKINRPIITIIDYTLASTQKRLWVIDIDNRQILHTSLVAHGKHSGENYAKYFSNTTGSLQTSIGVFLTENTYIGKEGYSLRIQGLESGFNDKAKSRAIVMHGANYVSGKTANSLGRVGRSWGCPAVERQLAKPIINTIKDGTIIFSFYTDKNWLKNSQFING
jgi:hypothetical protein